MCVSRGIRLIVKSANWPKLLEDILPRLDHVECLPAFLPSCAKDQSKIVHNDFPIPKIPLPEPLPPTTLNTGSSNDNTTQSSNAIVSSQQTEKLPTQGSTPPALPVDGSTPEASTSVIPNSQTSALQLPEGTLPPPLLSFYTNLKTNLSTSFSDAPPYTIQRLAELVLYPTTHYRTLPAYLRALDRTISVSSNSDVFPLPSSGLDTINSASNGAFLASSTGPPHADDFNGAALTRIPWLRDTASMLDTSERSLGGMGIAPGPDLRTESTSVIDGPNGAGSIETVTVTVNGVPSSGAGTTTATHPCLSTVPTDGVTPSSVRPSAAVTSAVTEAPQPDGSSNSTLPRSPMNTEDEEEELPHARGPEEIGMEDMGPQSMSTMASGRGGSAGPAVSLTNVEKAMGRPGEGEVVGGTDENKVEEQLEDEEAKEEEVSSGVSAQADADAMSIDEVEKPVEDKE